MSEQKHQINSNNNSNNNGHTSGIARGVINACLQLQIIKSDRRTDRLATRTGGELRSSSYARKKERVEW